MLERLTVRDLALVEHAEVEFGPGLDAVTGETGAGKSLLVQAVNLLVGGRADSDAVREGARAAVVEGEFRLAPERAAAVAALLEDWGVDFDGATLIVRREVQAGGKSRAVVNQSPVTLAALKRLGELLADLHGQHEHQSLLRPDAGLETLDRLAALGARRARFAEALAARRAAHEALAALERSLETFAERRDYLAEALRELDDARLEEGEDERLRVEASRLAHADRLRLLVAEALGRLTEGDAPALGHLAAALHAVEQGARLDPSLEEALPWLREAEIATAEAGRALAGYADRLEADPEALERIEERRALIARLTRKYRREVPDLIAWREEVAAELATGENADDALAHARAAAAEADAACRREGAALTRARVAAARTWSRAITAELAPLGMPHARIEFVVASHPGDEPGPTGYDTVELRFTPNLGEPARPLQKIASGGELSRVMLALKCALETQDRVDLLLFDEVDSGIGGTVAQAVGERLRRLARHRQVICVTHLPMIAALADRHHAVTKRVSGGRTTARVETLGREARVEEISRMLAGDRVTDTTRRQARELLGESPARAGAR
uniref:DNA repair protein RecN n=1 Tax=Eiseniibacteriota bacterium TaxID=2212470 RepID=A0A832I249_UNCEI